MRKNLVWTSLLVLLLLVKDIQGVCCIPDEIFRWTHFDGTDCPQDRIGAVAKQELYTISMWSQGCGYHNVDKVVWGTGPCFPGAGCCTTGNIQSCWPEFDISFTDCQFWGKNVRNRFVNTQTCLDNCPDEIVLAIQHRISLFRSSTKHGNAVVVVAAAAKSAPVSIVLTATSAWKGDIAILACNNVLIIHRY